MIKLSLFSCLLLTCIHAFAWNEVGNGGYVIKRGDHYELLDLVENGVSYDPYDPPDQVINPKVISFLKEHVSYKNNAIIESLARKISAAKDLYPPVAYSLLKSFSRIQWKFVSAPLEKIDDVGYTPLDIKNLDIYQTAIRKHNYVYVNKEILEKMQPTHAAALLFHEIFYAVARPLIYEDSNKRRVLILPTNYDSRKKIGNFYHKRNFESSLYLFHWFFSDEVSIRNDRSPGRGFELVRMYAVWEFPDGSSERILITGTNGFLGKNKFSEVCKLRINGMPPKRASLETFYDGWSDYLEEFAIPNWFIDTRHKDPPWSGYDLQGGCPDSFDHSWSFEPAIDPIESLFRSQINNGSIQSNSAVAIP